MPAILSFELHQPGCLVRLLPGFLQILPERRDAKHPSPVCHNRAVFYRGSGMEEIIVGVVGVLQFEVLKYRLENEYNVEIKLENLPYEKERNWEDLNKIFLSLF